MKSLADVLGVSNSQSSTSTPSTPVKLTVKSLAKGIIESAQYRESIHRRILNDTLPPAVECKMYEYAYGKPIDKMEIVDKRNDLGDMTSEQLEVRAQELALLARKLRGEEAEATGEVAPGVH